MEEIDATMSDIVLCHRNCVRREGSLWVFRKNWRKWRPHRVQGTPTWLRLTPSFELMTVCLHIHPVWRQGGSAWLWVTLGAGSSQEAAGESVCSAVHTCRAQQSGHNRPRNKVRIWSICSGANDGHQMTGHSFTEYYLPIIKWKACTSR